MQATEVIKRNLYRLFYIPIVGIFLMLLSMCTDYHVKLGKKESDFPFILHVCMIQLFSLLILTLSLIFK